MAACLLKVMQLMLVMRVSWGRILQGFSQRMLLCWTHVVRSPPADAADAHDAPVLYRGKGSRSPLQLMLMMLVF